VATLNKKQEQAMALFLAATPIIDIANSLNVARTTITAWRKKFNWQIQAVHKPLKQQVSDRIHVLLQVMDKTVEQNKELKTLLACADDDYAQRLDPKTRNQGQGRVAKDKRGNKLVKVKNSFEGVTQKDFDTKFDSLLLGYQRKWREAKISHAKGEMITCSETGKKIKMPRTRAILKSRQIGATWYFAAEAFEDAVLTGDNQIFLSASQNQAFIFRSYIRQFAKDWFGVELKGTDSIELWNGATIYFLATSARTAQGYHGHTYMDEFFWMPNFKEFKKVATGMSAHKKWRRTYFSTPSALSHQAYGLWSGSRMKNAKDKDNVDITNTHLKYGAIGSDRIWRMVTTITDAEQMGCNFFDIEELKDEHSDAEFDNLFLCKFVDDADSVFKLTKLQKGVVESGVWADFNPKASQPFGQRPVWLGYDPARTTDDASLVVVAPPLKDGGKFRLLERHRWKGETFEYQANMIKIITQKYNVQKIAMDTSGMGYGAYERVEEFFPLVIPICYTSLIKNHMVAKMQDVVNSERFDFQDDDISIMSSFMAIGKTATGSGKIVVNAKRSDVIGHADVAWAIMHAIYQEPTNAKHVNRESSLARRLRLNRK
jgi:uncharacterized protein YjcR